MDSLESFKKAVATHLEDHPIVRMNPYTSWFARGEASFEELRHFAVQFSVFSHLFIEAQLRKCINARDLASYRAGKEILMNELGVTFAPSGSVDQGTFRFHAAHFEWLAAFAGHFGLEFHEIGKRELGTPPTLAFCDALMSWYASRDTSESTGASHAIENWAAAGFWKQLISGLRRVKGQRMPDLPLGFWVWHDQLEEQHATHTHDELTTVFAQPGFDGEKFLRAGTAVLDAVEIFWEGLSRDRRSRAA
ncbi:MAG: hypothetical protein ABR508_03570 [Candidatus Baltobacteraceae bacterium]